MFQSLCVINDIFNNALPISKIFTRTLNTSLTNNRNVFVCRCSHTWLGGRRWRLKKCGGYLSCRHRLLRGRHDFCCACFWVCDFLCNRLPYLVRKVLRLFVNRILLVVNDDFVSKHITKWLGVYRLNDSTNHFFLNFNL